MEIDRVNLHDWIDELCDVLDIEVEVDEETGHVESKPSQLRDRVDEDTRKLLEKLRRGQGSG